jgi:phosphatidylserine decarboxylase
MRAVRYISGDTWNVNPIALKRVEQLFCKNERAVLPVEPPVPGAYVTLVPIAAILVASIRLHFVATHLNLKYNGAMDLSCDAKFVKGQELGYFESGSTIVMFVSGDFEFSPNVAEGSTVQMGEALFTHSAPISAIGENDERFD